MEIEKLPFDGLVLFFKPSPLKDKRGFFFESYNQKVFEKATGFKATFVQDNQSKSKKYVLRGLHYQIPPHEQGKLVRVIKGKIYDVVLDLRKNKSTFGKWMGIELTHKSKHQLWVPPGFAHGFVTLSKKAEIIYKVTNFYNKDSEHCIRWNDPEINIDWAGLYNQVILSDKDSLGKSIKESYYFCN